MTKQDKRTTELGTVGVHDNQAVYYSDIKSQGVIVPRARDKMSEGSVKRQSTTKSLREAKTNFKKPIKGDIEELGNFVYTYGSRDHCNKFWKTTDAIADYVGREYNKAMRVLVKNSKECPPEEPKEPEGKVSDVEMKQYEKKLSRYYAKLDEYTEYKAKVFVIIKGQCTLTMKNKVEGMKDYDKIEEDDDVISLLKCLKDLAFTTVDVQYEHWTVVQSLKRLMTM